jgi:hypothetical protein
LSGKAKTDVDRRETNPKLGFDAETTGVTILNQDPVGSTSEKVLGNYVRMELDQGYNYSINHNQNGNEIRNYEINPRRWYQQSTLISTNRTNV